MQVLETEKKLQEVIEKAAAYDRICQLFGSKNVEKSFSTVKRSTSKPRVPTQRKAAYRVYSCLHGRKSPMTIEKISKAVGLKASTIKNYIFKYSCFHNIRGKGYMVLAA